MKKNIVILLLVNLLLISCATEQQSNNIENSSTTPTFQNKGHELVYNMVQKVGDFSKLHQKNNVTYTYTYTTPDGKKDISTEKYIFDGELSYGKYETHERTLPQLEGIIEQGYDGHNFWLKHNGTLLPDTQLLKRVAFNRPTNFYWFAMMPKLLDPGLNYEYLGTKSIDQNDYEIVKVTFTSEDTKPKDIYQVYINKKTGLVDQFLFTVADFGKMDPLLMQVKYEEVDGIWIPTDRQYKQSNWEADVTEQPWIKVTWTNIKFNTKITIDDFKA